MNLTGIQSSNCKKQATRLGLVVCFGGDKRDRTADLLNAIQALSQLSYTPMVLKPLILLDFCVIRLSCSAGRFTGQLPSQLSYTPTSIFSCKVVEISGIEPLTS